MHTRPFALSLLLVALLSHLGVYDVTLPGGGRNKGLDGHLGSRGPLNYGAQLNVGGRVESGASHTITTNSRVQRELCTPTAAPPAAAAAEPPSTARPR
jgi:hypothetical protein